MYLGSLPEERLCCWRGACGLGLRGRVPPEPGWWRGSLLPAVPIEYGCMYFLLREGTLPQGQPGFWPIKKELHKQKYYDSFHLLESIPLALIPANATGCYHCRLGHQESPGVPERTPVSLLAMSRILRGSEDEPSNAGDLITESGLKV